MKKILIILLPSLILLSLFFSDRVLAAPKLSIYFSGVPEAVAAGDSFPVKILLDSNQPLNAYLVKFSFPNDVLEITGFNNSDSIVDVWQSLPKVFETGRVEFGGGSIKAFSGVGGVLMTINLKAIKAGEVKLNFSDTSFYLANGKGTKVLPQAENLIFEVGSESNREQLTLPEIKDNSVPDVKYLAIIPDPLNSARQLLSFMVADVGSGIKETTIRTRRWFWWSENQPAVNPETIASAVWAVDFRVADNNGNVSEKVVYNWRAFFVHTFSFLFFGLIILLLVINKLIKKKRYNK